MISPPLKNEPTTMLPHGFRISDESAIFFEKEKINRKCLQHKEQRWWDCCLPFRQQLVYFRNCFSIVLTFFEKRRIIWLNNYFSEVNTIWLGATNYMKLKFFSKCVKMHSLTIQVNNLVFTKQVLTEFSCRYEFCSTEWWLY